MEIKELKEPREEARKTWGDDIFRLQIAETGALRKLTDKVPKERGFGGK